VVSQLRCRPPGDGSAATPRNTPRAGAASRIALEHVLELFAAGPEALGAQMAGRADQLAGDPAEVIAATATLAAGLLANVGTS
jgi:hypothetical protein